MTIWIYSKWLRVFLKYLWWLYVLGISFKITWSMIQKVFKQEGYPFSIITAPAILTLKWHYRKTVFCRWGDIKSYEDVLFLGQVWCTELWRQVKQYSFDVPLGPFHCEIQSKAFTLQSIVNPDLWPNIIFDPKNDSFAS